MSAHIGPDDYRPIYITVEVKVTADDQDGSHSEVTMDMQSDWDPNQPLSAIDSSVAALAREVAAAIEPRVRRMGGVA